MKEPGPELLALRRDEIHSRSFAPASDSLRVGAEVEFLALDEQTRMPVALLGGNRGLVSLIRRFGGPNGWTELAGYGPVPKFLVADKGVVSFEPGGQVEFSANAQHSVSSLLRVLESIVFPLRAALFQEGVHLESVGIDPRNDARDITLQLPVERYETMTRYFDRLGPFGIRMMRQTAAIQISLERGPVPADRWRLLNDLAPFVVAVFANSPSYLGEDTGHQSFRAYCWRMLDPTRTGVAIPSHDPALAYARFALSANDMSRSLEGDVPFLACDCIDDQAAWETHLTTLFPEVRPRGHFEVRSCDAIDPSYYAAPLIFLTGLAYDSAASRDAAVLAGDSRSLLRAAGERGLHDPSIARVARDLCDLALAGASRLGTRYCDNHDLQVAREFFRNFTMRDRSPADDRVAGSQISSHRSTPALTK